jgi:hypothetical protein
MTNDDATDKPGFNGPERRKKARRADKDRRDCMRRDLENPIRRKSPGRRVLDRVFYLLNPKRYAATSFRAGVIGMSGVAAAKSTHT